MLRQYFEGKEVLVKRDTPVDSSGVAVEMEADTPLNYRELEYWIRQFGVVVKSQSLGLA